MKKKVKPVDLDAIRVQFVRAYVRAGLGITFVGKTTNGLKVVVKTVRAASKIPTEFSGVPVTVYQDLGPAGEKLLVRNKHGKVTASGLFVATPRRTHDRLVTSVRPVLVIRQSCFSGNYARCF